MTALYGGGLVEPLVAVALDRVPELTVVAVLGSSDGNVVGIVGSME